MPNIIYQNPEYIKKRGNPRHSGAQALLARVTGLTSTYINDLVRGRCNAGKDRAIRLGELLGCPPEIWLPGGAPEARRAAVEAWALKHH